MSWHHPAARGPRLKIPRDEDPGHESQDFPLGKHPPRAHRVAPTPGVQPTSLCGHPLLLLLLLSPSLFLPDEEPLRLEDGGILEEVRVQLVHGVRDVDISPSFEQVRLRLCPRTNILNSLSDDEISPHPLDGRRPGVEPEGFQVT